MTPYTTPTLDTNALTIKDQLPMFDLDTMQPAPALIDQAPEAVNSPDIDARRQSYANKRAARVARLYARAEKASAEGNAKWNRAGELSQLIPLGQPILVGHYSEKRDRNFRERLDSQRRTAYNLMKKGENLMLRAQAAEKNDAISSDNPDAVEMLEAKRAKFEAEQEMMVSANKLVRKNDRAGLVALMSKHTNPKRAEVLAHKLFVPDFCNRIGFPDYALKNNNANIRRITARIETLKRNAKMSDSRETIGTIDVEADTLENRVRLHFPGKPAPDVIKALKSYGFRWSPSNEAWQRQLNDGALRLAREIAKQYGGEA